MIAMRVKENRFKILMLCYLSFAIISNTISTGAFEVYLDNSLVFSKLQKYRYPTEEVETLSIVNSCCRILSGWLSILLRRRSNSKVNNHVYQYPLFAL